MRDKIFGGLFGVIVGDALGVPVEFRDRYYMRNHPITDMVGNGTYNLPAGTWSDDSSMMLCLVDVMNNGIDYNKIASNFVNWYKKAKFTPYKEVFDIGSTCKNSIENILKGIEPIKCGLTSDNSCGNGSLMRILPLSFYNIHKDTSDILDVIENVSAITHGHNLCKLACIFYIEFARDLIIGYNKEEALDKAIEFIKYNCWDKNGGKYTTKELMKFNLILCKDICIVESNEIRSDGYCVHTLEAALWCLMNSNSYSECVLKAVNLGNDTDTTAAVAGGLAGILYGYDNIPIEWIDKLARKDWLIEEITKFSEVILK